jgi:spermidine synthase
MTLKDQFQNFLSYFFPVKLKTFHSNFSGDLYIYKVNGKKVLDTHSVNYSFNALHKVFKRAFAKTGIDPQNTKNVLILGLGGGSIVQLLRSEHHIKSPITAIEIDPVIVEIARSEFDLHKYDPINIVVSDAQLWMNENTTTFDIICVDLFINAEVPSPFLQTGFIDQLVKATNTGGTIYFNIMIINKKIHSAFSSIQHHSSQLSGLAISSVEYIEVEENNRVLIIRK